MQNNTNTYDSLRAQLHSLAENSWDDHWVRVRKIEGHDEIHLEKKAAWLERIVMWLVGDLPSQDLVQVMEIVQEILKQANTSNDQAALQDLHKIKKKFKLLFQNNKKLLHCGQFHIDWQSSEVSIIPKDKNFRDFWKSLTTTSTNPIVHILGIGHLLKRSWLSWHHHMCVPVVCQCEGKEEKLTLHPLHFFSLIASSLILQNMISDLPLLPSEKEPFTIVDVSSGKLKEAINLLLLGFTPASTFVSVLSLWDVGQYLDSADLREKCEKKLIEILEETRTQDFPLCMQRIGEITRSGRDISEQWRKNIDEVCSRGLNGLEEQEFYEWVALIKKEYPFIQSITLGIKSSVECENSEAHKECTLAEVNEKQLEALTQLSEVQYFTFQHCRITGTLHNLHCFKQLKALHFLSSNVAEKEAFEQISKVTQLKEIIFLKSNVEDANLASFSKLKQLQHFSVIDCPNIRGRIVMTFDRHEQLKSLNFSQCRMPFNVGDLQYGWRLIGYGFAFPNLVSLDFGPSGKMFWDQIANVAKCKKLQYLHFYYQESQEDKEANEYFGKFSELLELRKLKLGGSHAWRYILTPLTSLKNLSNLYFYDFVCPKQENLEELARLTQLQSLTLADCEISDQMLSYVACLENLEELVLYKCKNISYTGLEYLIRLKQLKRLALKDVGIISSEEIKNLQKEMPEVEFLTDIDVADYPPKRIPLNRS